MPTRPALDEFCRDLEAAANEAMMADMPEWAILMYRAAVELRRLRDALGPREV